MNDINRSNQQPSSGNQQVPYSQSPQYGKPPSTEYQSPPYGKKSASARIILSVIMLVLGSIICFVNAMMLIIAFVMPNSIGAYYIMDMIENGLLIFNPIFLLVIGAVLIVVGMILIFSTSGRSSKKQG